MCVSYHLCAHYICVYVLAQLLQPVQSSSLFPFLIKQDKLSWIIYSYSNSGCLHELSGRCWASTAVVDGWRNALNGCNKTAANEYEGV